jgi:hypothetical protein
MNYPAAPISGIAASLGQATGYPAENYNRPRERGIKPSSAGDGTCPPEMGLVRRRRIKIAGFMHFLSTFLFLKCSRKCYPGQLSFYGVSLPELAGLYLEKTL